jgi:hypothetical protein
MKVAVVHNDLRRIEVLMNAARLGRNHRAAKPIARREDAVEASFPIRARPAHIRETLVKDAQLIRHAVRALSRDMGAMQFVNRRRHAPAQFHAAARIKEFARNLARNFSLQPHPKLRQHAHRLRQRHTISAVVSESRVPQKLLQAIGFVPWRSREFS